MAPGSALIILSAILATTDLVAASPNVIGVDFVKEVQQRRVSSTTSLRRRQATVQPALVNTDDVSYYMNVTVGTPGQPLAFQLDTGSYV